MNKTIKVFLASSSELEKDRREFEIAIHRKNKDLNKQGLFIESVKWEDFKATLSETRSQDEYNKAIRECDIFVMLFFSKVGKYSDEEFNIALESFKNKARPLILVFRKNAPINSLNISENTQSLINFTQKLSEIEHFPIIYENLDGLVRIFFEQFDKIYAQDLKEDTSPIVAEVIPSEESTPPKPKTKRGISHSTISYFTERVDELKEFQDAYENHNFLSISGTGGIGKTQFTTRCVEACNIPKEKTVWFECQPATTLDTVINHAGFPEILKGESKRDKEKVLAFIDKINEHELVLFLEDYHDVQKTLLLADLLKECGTRLISGKIIVISRNNMVDKFIQPKQVLLKGFKNDDELLNYLSNLKDFFKIEDKCTDDDLFELFKKLEGHPFAISLACILIQDEVKISEIIEEIIHENEGDNSNRLLNAIFNRDDATEEEKDFIKNFSAFRGKVDREDIVNIFSKDDLRTARKLRNKNLLVIEDEQFSLHPLVREFCYKKLEAKTEIHKKISAHYITQRQELLEVELEDRIFYHLTIGKEHDKISKTIVSLGRQFIQQGFTDILENMMETLGANFIDLPEITNILYGEILEMKGEWDEALAFYEKASQSSVERIRIKGLINIGELFLQKGEIENATSILKKATKEISVNESIYLKEKADVLNVKGLIEHFQNRNKEALEIFEQNLKILKEIGDKSRIATSYNNIGYIYHDFGYHKKTMDCYEKGLKIAKEIGDKSGMAACYNNIGLFKSDLGKYNEALDLLEISLKILEELGAKSRIARCYANIGAINSYLGFKQEAFLLFKESLEIGTEIGDKSCIANSLYQLGKYYRKIKNIDLACFSFLKSYAIYKYIDLHNQNNLKSKLIELRKENKSIFKESVQIAFESLPEDLKNKVDMNDILGIPIKAKKQPGRNDQCHCGSGKKFKHCHGK